MITSMGTYLLLRKKPAFLRGAARAIDLGATLNRDAYGVSRSAHEADSSAIRSDWIAVGRDLRSALKKASKLASRH